MAGVVNHHVLDDLEAQGMSSVDEVLIVASGAPPRVDPRPVIAVIAVVVGGQNDSRWEA